MSSGSPSAAEAELLAVSQRLLDSIADRDWGAYSELCDESLTCFEPEAGWLVLVGVCVLWL